MLPLIIIALIWLAGVVGWIAALVEISRLPDSVFVATGRARNNTALLVGITGFLGALYYWIFLRKELDRAR